MENFSHPKIGEIMGDLDNTYCIDCGKDFVYF